MPFSPSPDSGDLERLLEVIAGLVRETNPAKVSQVSPNARFDRDLGLDSLARVELVLRVGSAFRKNLPEAALTEPQTPLELLHFLGAAELDTAPATGTATTLERTEGGLPENASTLVDILEWHAARHPQSIHVLFIDEAGDEHPISYATLLADARRCADALSARGVSGGQSVALMLPSGPEYLASFFGVLIAGGVPVPIYPPARLSQIEEHLRRHAKILANAETVALITVDAARPVAAMLRAAVPGLDLVVTPGDLAESTPTASKPEHRRSGADDLAFLQYTSGSTGDPKGVMLTHANLLANIRAIGLGAEITAADVTVSWLPLYHDMGLIGCWLGSLYHGIPLVLMSPLSFLSRPARWLTAISRHRGTISAAPNFAYELCTHKVADDELGEVDLSSWRLALNGAEPVSAATLEAFAARFAPWGFREPALMPVYGLAECSVALAFPPPGRGPRIDRIDRAAFAATAIARPAAAGAIDTLALPVCGRPLSGHDLRIVDDADGELGERRVGRLQFRGPSATAGYFRNPAATAKLIRNGWLESGDTAYLTDGEVVIAGRSKDLIIRGGRNIYPYDLEKAVGELPGVRNGCVAVFGSPDPKTGTERLVVMAETRETVAAGRAELTRLISETALALLGQPVDDIVLAPPRAVLKTSSGKIRRSACKEAYETGQIGSSGEPAWRTGVRLAVATWHAQIVIAGRRIGRLLWAGWVWTTVFLLAVPFAGSVALLRRPALARPWARLGCRLFLRLAGFRLNPASPLELPTGPHVLICNHAGYLDGLVLLATLPARPGYTFIAKRELAHSAFSRAVLGGLGARFIERYELRQSAGDVDAMTEALRAGERLMVFPEGTFTRVSGLRPFRLGAFVAAVQAGVPVVVCAITGTRQALRDETWIPQRGTLRLAVADTLNPDGSDWAAAVRLARRARTAMLPLTGEPDLE